MHGRTLGENDHFGTRMRVTSDLNLPRPGNKQKPAVHWPQIMCAQIVGQQIQIVSRRSTNRSVLRLCRAQVWRIQVGQIGPPSTTFKDRSSREPGMTTM
jgi:hypothetical protein